MISFARGIPAPEMFPTAELAEASQRAFEKHGATALNYGAPGGFGPLQEWLADLHGAAPEQIVISPGSLLMLGLIVRVLVPTPRPVLVESPAYDRMNLLLQRAGASIVPITRTSAGLDVDALETYLQTGEQPAFLYLMPTFHNPTGTTLSLADRERLADLAIRYDLAIVEDDPYGALRVDGDALPLMRDVLVARGAARLSLFTSSFSKIVAPGLRVGYGVLPAHLVGPIAAAALETYVSPPLWPQAEIYEFLSAGCLPGHLCRVQGLLRERRDALVDRLAAGLDGHGQMAAPGGRLLHVVGAACGDPRAGPARRLRACGSDLRARIRVLHRCRRGECRPVGVQLRSGRGHPGGRGPFGCGGAEPAVLCGGRLMEQRRGDLVLTDDQSRMSVETIHRWLSAEAYWSLGRTLAAVTESLRRSHVYGVLDGEEQAGLARVITDGVSFAYICDVFVAEGRRNAGIGGWLVDAMLADLRASNVKQVLLATRDAHALYQRKGFHTLNRPERWLEIDPTVEGTT